MQVEATIAEFEYTKDNGEVSARKILVLSRPSETYLGIEFEDEVELAGYFEFMVEREEMEKALKEKYGIGKEEYRRFRADNITSQITEEKIPL